MSDNKDELKKRKRKKPKKETQEEFSVKKKRTPRPRRKTYTDDFIPNGNQALEKQQPLLKPEEPTSKLGKTEVIPIEEEKIEEGAFEDYLPTEKDMIEMYIDHLREVGTFGSATLSVLRYVLSNESEKNKEGLLSKVDNNAEMISDILQKIANEVYEYSNFIASANSIIELVAGNPSEYYEMLQEAAYYDSISAQSVIRNEYKD